MKKRRAAVFVLLLLMLIAVMSAFVSCGGTTSTYECVQYATKKYGMEEILCTIRMHYLVGFDVDGKYLGLDVYSLMDDEYSPPYDYYLGLKNGEEVGLIFPLFRGSKICESKWVFDVSFKEMAQMINAKAGKEICPLGADLCIMAYNTLYQMDEITKLVPEIENFDLDKPILLEYPYSNTEYYAIVQSGGELLIFEIQ